MEEKVEYVTAEEIRKLREEVGGRITVSVVPDEQFEPDVIAIRPDGTKIKLKR